MTRHVRRATVAPALTLVLVAALAACSDAAGKAGQLASVATSLRDPWAAGCVAVDVGLRVNHVDRSAQLRILDGVAGTPALGEDFRSWLRLARTALAYTDPLAIGGSERAALERPCAQHGHPISAFGAATRSSGQRSPQSGRS